MKALLPLLALLSTSAAFATEADIVNCSNRGGTRVQVQQIGGGTIDGQILVIVNGTTYSNHRTDNLNDESSFTISALLPGTRGNGVGVLGNGVMLAVELPNGVIARNGLIEKLDCVKAQ
jgi:hypothetical protein